MTTDAKVFVIDDDPAARDSVSAVVRSKGVTVEAYATAEDFLNAFDGATYGCIVTDVRMTGMSGLDLQDALRRKGVSLPVVIITGFGDVPTAVRAMKGGAFSFLEKPCQNSELWAAIQGALEASLARRDEETQHQSIRRNLESLTPDERRVLSAMVAGKPNKTVAAEFDLGLRTVELRRANIMKKMHADSLATLVRYALVAGVAPEN